MHVHMYTLTEEPNLAIWEGIQTLDRFVLFGIKIKIKQSPSLTQTNPSYSLKCKKPNRIEVEQGQNPTPNFFRWPVPIDPFPSPESEPAGGCTHCSCPPWRRLDYNERSEKLIE